VARPRATQGQSVSLFPFLSILACVIGVLTLLITALALGQMNTKSDDEKIQRAEDYLAMVKRLPELRRQVGELERLVAQAEVEKLRKLLAAARAERSRLAKMLSHDDTDRKDVIIKLLAEVKALQERIRSLELQLRERLELIKPLLEELAKRNEPVESEVIVQPGGSGDVRDTKHTFVEANKTGIVIYEGDKLHRIASGNIAADAQFLKVCKQVAAEAKAVIIFLIRTDGFGTYNLANRTARAQGARTGKLPVIGQGHINLKMFATKP